MSRRLVEEGERNRKKIEMVLATSKKPMTLSEIAEECSLPVSTVKRHLDMLASIGRVHIEHHRGSNLYRWNGKEVYQDKVFLSDDHILFIDAMINPWGRPFIRVKERKYGKDIGAIIIDEKRIDEFIEKLQSISQNLQQYKGKSNE